MTLSDDDDSVFEQALRADLPSLSEQNRLRQRLLAAGIAAGTALGSTNVAAATQASFGASALSKLSALSWPAKLGLTAVLAAPVVVGAPLVYAPVRAAEMVSQVQSSAASVHARAVTKSQARGAATGAQQAPLLESSGALREAGPGTPPPESVAQANFVARSKTAALDKSAASESAAAPSPAVSPSVGNSESATAAFVPAPSAAPADEAQPARNTSTLAAETRLLDRAFAALAAGDRRTASALVAEHARLFPNGLLRQERERARTRLATDPKGE